MADSSPPDTVIHSPTVEQTAGADAVNIGQHAQATPTHESAEHESGGLPQFQFQHWPGQIVYLLILFAILYVLMSKVFAPRIRRVFDEREATISGALASAQQVQAEAAAQAEEARLALADARAKAHRTALEAKARAEAEARARQGEADAEIEAQMAQAEAAIQAARDGAMSHLDAAASEVAEAILEKLTGDAASREVVESALAETRR